MLERCFTVNNSDCYGFRWQEKKYDSKSLKTFRRLQCAKKVVSDSPGLVDFAIGLVNSVFNLPDGQVMFFEEFE